MKLIISKIDTVLWNGEAESVTVPAAEGEMTILGHHMPLITTLRAGNIVVKQKTGKPETYLITSGFVEIGKEETVILV